MLGKIGMSGLRNREVNSRGIGQGSEGSEGSEGSKGSGKNAQNHGQGLNCPESSGGNRREVRQANHKSLRSALVPALALLQVRQAIRKSCKQTNHKSSRSWKISSRRSRRAMISVLSLLLPFLLTTPVLAQDGGTSVLDLATALRAIGIAIFGLAVLWGAAKIMASGGDQRFMEEGKNVIKNAIIGLILVIIASYIPDLLSGISMHPLVLIPT